VNWRRACLRIGAACCAAIPLALSADDGQSRTAGVIEVMCLAEQPAIVEGESVTLHAWASTPDGQPPLRPPALDWRVSDGSIDGQSGGPIRWNLSTVQVPQGETRKSVTASVTATDNQSGQTAPCRVEVFIGRPVVTAPDRGSLTETLFSAKRFLLSGESEEPGYGLYSYLLFSAPPTDEDQKARYLQTIEALLLIFQDVDAYLQRHVRPSRLNATYIPLTSTPRPGRSNAEWAANVLAAYDYAAALIMLDALDGSHRRGPYLVSMLSPLSGAKGRTYLFEELTGVVPDLAAERIRFFSYLAAQERSWSEATLERFTLKLRNLVAVGGKVAPDAVKGLMELVPFKRGG
jgi:hypothetical protein